jgi:hypothetical protein
MNQKNASKAACKLRVDQEVVELRAQVARLEKALAVRDTHGATEPTEPTEPTAPTEPKYRKYKSETMKKRAARRLRTVLCEYAPAGRPDLLARTIMTDGRGKECGISVSLVHELLATPRMARHMKAHAEAILEAAKEHMMKEVFSASSLTAARPLLCFSYRKLQWLRRLLSYDGKTHRVMHPEYSTTVPSFPTIPEMKADEADMLKREGGVLNRRTGVAQSAKI